MTVHLSGFSNRNLCEIQSLVEKADFQISLLGKRVIAFEKCHILWDEMVLWLLKASKVLDRSLEERVSGIKIAIKLMDFDCSIKTELKKKMFLLGLFFLSGNIFEISI